MCSNEEDKRNWNEIFSKLDQIVQTNKEILARLERIEEELKRGPDVSAYTLILSMIFGLVVLGASLIVEPYRTTEKVYLGWLFVIAAYGTMFLLLIRNIYKRRAKS